MTRTLVLLVGSNPLPNYLAASTLRPKRALLLHTAATADIKDRLVAALRNRLGIEVPDGPGGQRCIADATSASAARDAMTDLPQDAHLDYTGGTKVMAAHARAVFAQHFGDDRASYVDERAGALRLDDGTSRSLETAEFDLRLLAELHGVDKLTTHQPREGDPTADDTSRMATHFVADPGRISRLNDLERKPQALRNSPVLLMDYGLDLSVTAVPDNSWGNKRIERWRDFLAFEWLELWIASLIRQVADGAVVEQDVNAERPEQFQLDVAAVRGHRLYAISCTTDAGKYCKSKAFEIALRARHLGGDLARPALVCALDGVDPNDNDRLDKLSRDIQGYWPEGVSPRIFGMRHLRSWVGGDFDELSDWLSK